MALLAYKQVMDIVTSVDPDTGTITRRATIPLGRLGGMRHLEGGTPTQPAMAGAAELGPAAAAVAAE